MMVLMKIRAERPPIALVGSLSALPASLPPFLLSSLASASETPLNRPNGPMEIFLIFFRNVSSFTFENRITI
jgi:hypothetical protein